MLTKSGHSVFRKSRRLAAPPVVDEEPEGEAPVEPKPIELEPTKPKPAEPDSEDDQLVIDECSMAMEVRDEFMADSPLKVDLVHFLYKGLKKH